jgi:hypothetical protein
VTDGSLIENLNKTGVRLWTDRPDATSMINTTSLRFGRAKRRVAFRLATTHTRRRCPRHSALVAKASLRLPPAADLSKYDVLNVSVGTDPALATKTRRGTGYYQVPSLKGVWYRGPFEHNGSAATLEDWFDPARLHDDYVPTGFRGYGIKTRALKGHEFGLRPPEEEKKALIAFLKTLSTTVAASN